jgi:ADP-ribose pyrophosphatase
MPIVFASRVFSVESGTAQFPNGKEHDVAIVRHPPSVVLIPMQDEHHVVLIRQYRHSIKKEIWELPAGGLNPGESAEEAAARECEEEIGLAPGRIDRLQSLFPTPGYCDEEMIFFRVSELRRPPPESTRRPDEDEDIRPQAFTVAAAKGMVRAGQIVDLKTAYGLTLIP